MEKNTILLLKDLTEFWGAALLVVIMTILTKQKWVWKAKFGLIFVWCLISWYFASWIPAYFLPEMYNWQWRTLLNWVTTVISFMAMLYAFDKNVFYDAFDFYKNKKLK